MATECTLRVIRDAIGLRAKAQIIMDARTGRFAPRPHEQKTGEITNYGDLHDYVDANYYGGAFEDDLTERLAGILGFTYGPDDADGNAFNEVINQFFDPMQTAVNAWIMDGGIPRVLKMLDDPAAELDTDMVRALAGGLPVVDAIIMEAFL